MRSLYIIISLATLVCFSAGNANGAPKSKPSKTKKTLNISNEKYDETAFNLTRTAMPKGYNGHDAMKIFAAFDKLGKLTKDEFETTEEFVKRKDKEQSKPIIGKLTSNDVYAFVIKPEAIYDADGGLLTLNVSNTVTLNKFSLPNPGIGFRLKNLTDHANFTDEQNSYGSTVRVKNSIHSQSNMVVTNSESDLSMRYKYDFSGKKIKRLGLDGLIIYLKELTPAIAKEYKEQVRIIFAVTLESPFYSSGMELIPATYNFPYSDTSTDYNVHCKVIEIWVYNLKTGKILKKEKVPQKRVPTNADVLYELQLLGKGIDDLTPDIIEHISNPNLTKQ